MSYIVQNMEFRKIITPVKDLNPGKLQFSMKVHVLNLWTNPSKFNPNEVYSIDMILTDEAVFYNMTILYLLLLFKITIFLYYLNYMHLQGDVIQATLYKQQFYKFQDQLQEGSSYLIVSPTIGRQPPSFLLRDQVHKLIFIDTTSLQKTPSFTGDTDAFSFVDYPIIQSTDFPDNRSVGKLHLS